MNLVEQVGAYIGAHALVPPGGRVLVGVSGGLDSVALLTVMHRLGYPVAAAHVNYGLRGDASEDDAEFVRALCARLGVKLFMNAVYEVPGEERGGATIQAWARDIRYAFFARWAEVHGYTAVAVGHHRDDQAETVLLNLFRGTGLEGAVGMAPSRPLAAAPAVPLIRPLLGVRRAEIASWARAEKVAWREDASNADPVYRRNALRHSRAALEDVFGEGAWENVARFADRLRAYRVAEVAPIQEALRLAALRTEGEDEDEGAGGRVPLDVLDALPPVWRGRLLLDALARFLPGAPVSDALADALDALRTAQPGRRLVLPHGTVWREREALFFAPPPPPGAATNRPRPVVLDTPLTLPEGRLHIERLDMPPASLDTGTPHVVFVDADRLGSALTVRRWRPGDRMQPLGMSGTKKVSDLLTDVRTSPAVRTSALVLWAGETLAWVIGVRLAEPFRVRTDTRQIAKITFIPADKR